MNFNQGQPGHKNPIAYLGNNAKALHVSVEASLKKLRTTYIDLFYVHWWDYSSSIEEVMGHLHDLVAAKKILYLVSRDLKRMITKRNPC
jgi:aryl-alcohol dehydrogenase-like predicted oxidoreductase